MQGEGFIWLVRDGLLAIATDSGKPVSALSVVDVNQTPHFPLPGGSGDSVCIAAADSVTNGLDWVPLRQCLDNLSERDFVRAGVALQIVHWWESHQYCSRCAQPLLGPEAHHLERLEFRRWCGGCESQYYPRINPCIIVLVTRGEQLLLANHARSVSGTYTTLAGFVEPGESIENAVHREVSEEVGLTLGNLTYKFSQSWPFPGQLMLGFHAEYAAGEITPQEDEIADAGWFGLHELPKVPPKGTIARRLIDDFRERRDTQHQYTSSKETHYRAL